MENIISVLRGTEGGNFFLLEDPIVFFLFFLVHGGGVPAGWGEALEEGLYSEALLQYVILSFPKSFMCVACVFIPLLRRVRVIFPFVTLSWPCPHSGQLDTAADTI